MLQNFVSLITPVPSCLSLKLLCEARGMSFSPADFVLLFRSPVTENQHCNLSNMTDLEISFSRYHRSQTVILVKVYIFLKA